MKRFSTLEPKSKTSSDSQHERAGFYSHVSPTHWQRAPSWPPVAACVSSSVDLGLPARLDASSNLTSFRGTHSHMVETPTRDSCPAGRSIFHTPPRPDLPPSGPRTAQPFQLCRSVVPPTAQSFQSILFFQR